MQIQIEFFSHQIKTLREAKQLTQEELAHELGISRQSIIALERGRCLPSLPLALSLADVFDLVLEDFIQPTEELTAVRHDQENVNTAKIIELENEWQIKVRLPENIDQDAISAEVNDGILTINMPKQKKDHKTIRIKIKSE